MEQEWSRLPVDLQSVAAASSLFAAHSSLPQKHDVPTPDQSICLKRSSLSLSLSLLRTINLLSIHVDPESGAN